MKVLMECIRDVNSPLPPHGPALVKGNTYVATMNEDGTFEFPIEDSNETIVILRDYYPVYFKFIREIEEETDNVVES